MTDMPERGQNSPTQRAGTGGTGSPRCRARQGTAAPKERAQPRRRPAPSPPELPRDRVYCRNCGAPVTSETYLLVVEGQSLHHRTNPAGVAYTLCCFSVAPGAQPVGEATSRYTWFAGHTWRVALCRSCDIHLGWQFEGDETGFFGLILDCLMTGSGATGVGS